MGTGYLIQNAAGESYISYLAFAQAIIDELFNAQFIGKRFTAVGEKS